MLWALKYKKTFQKNYLLCPFPLLHPHGHFSITLSIELSLLFIDFNVTGANADNCIVPNKQTKRMLKIFVIFMFSPKILKLVNYRLLADQVEAQ